MLSFRDKLLISWALTSMMGSLPADGAHNFQDWLVSHHQTRRAIRRFWGPVLVSALSEDLDRISVRYAAQVFRESFLNSAAAGRIGLPSVPLSDLYSSAAEYIRARGGEALLRSSVSAIVPTADGVQLTTASGPRTFDFAVLAVAFQAAAALLPDEPAAAPLKDKLGHFDAAPITGIHLWFDREVTPLPHAVLLDRTIQWMFQKSKFHDGDRNAGQGSYLELVVSASKSLVQKSREEVLEIALRELAEFFPAVKQAQVLKAVVVKEVYATYSVVPGLDQYRPGAVTPWPRLFLAGDWTATGWPATMEGAVRSGRLAAQAVSATAGRPENFLTPDLPPAGLMKLF